MSEGVASDETSDGSHTALVEVRNKRIKKYGGKSCVVFFKKDKIFLALNVPRNSCGMPGHTM